MTLHTSSRLARGLLLLSIGALAACDGGAPVQRRVSAAELAALPVVELRDSRLICTATGADLCPLGSAIANRVGPGRIALWEPGRQIVILDAENPTGRPFGVSGQSPSEYEVATAVGPYKGGIAVVDAQRYKLLQYSEDGVFKREDNLPPPTPNAAPGFAGDIPVLQTIRSNVDSGVAQLRVEVLSSQTESKGTLVLEAPVQWLRLRRDSTVSFTPLFARNPLWAIDPNKTIVWTPSDSFWVQRRRFDGKVLWTLSSDRPPLPVTDQDMSLRRSEIERTMPVGALRPGELDSMVAHTDRQFAAIGGFVVEPSGRLLVAGAITPSRDSVEYIVVSPEGQPTGRFNLGKRTRPLIFDGDSLLVHRPTEGEPWEVRWLRLTVPPPKK